MKTSVNKKLFLVVSFLVLSFNALAQISISFTVSQHNGYNVSCFAGRDGSITANVTGGTPPYTYLWSNTATTQTISTLAASYYAVTVTDSLGATKSNGVTLTEPSQIAVTLTSSSYSNGYNVSCYQCFNGSITNSPSGGITPYTYSWSDGTVANPITSQNRSSIGGGVYIVTLTDANGCTLAQPKSVSEPQRSDWTMTGNTGSNPPTNYIGTADNVDLVFKTNGTERMRIKADGKFSLSGETSLSRLVVSRIVSPDTLIYMGDSTIWYYPDQNRIFGGQSGAYKGMGLGVGTCAFGIKSTAIGAFAIANDNYSIAIGKYVETGSGVLNSVIIGSKESLPRFANNITNSLMVGFNSNIPTLYVGPSSGDNTIGNVGIGTTSPAGILEAKGNGASIFVTDDNTSTNGSASINLKNNTGKFWHFSGPRSYENKNNFSLFWYDGTNFQKYLTVYDNGKMGIGIDPPTNGTYKLYVETGIATRDVLVKSGTLPDYVFEENYSLRSLSELEKFIKVNKHLPEIPSAKEVEVKEGFEVGDMQIRLLKKVEELTLYIIEQNKKIESLEKKVSDISHNNK